MNFDKVETQGLKIENISKTFEINGDEVEALEDINLDVKEGEFISIVGASGCGKSTLLKLIMGLEKSTSGKIKVGERFVDKPSIDRGMIFQEARLYPWLTVEKNIEFGITKKLSKKEKKKIVAEHIELVGLNGFEKALPKQLSGGMQQRVSIARALVNNPDILLLDEPFGALDALTRISMQNEILKLWEVEKKTMILVTHDIDEAIYLGDRIVILSSRPGKIKKIVTVNLPRPRERTNSVFQSIRKEIYQHFFENTEYPIEYYI